MLPIVEFFVVHCLCYRLRSLLGLLHEVRHVERTVLPEEQTEKQLTFLTVEILLGFHIIIGRICCILQRLRRPLALPVI